MNELATQFRGTITELKVATRLLEYGFIVSRPLIDNRYDYILDIGEAMYKIQVKTANEKDGFITFKTCNTHTNTQGTFNRNYKGEIDFFATFFQGEVYLVPIEECGSRSKRLRITKAKNNQEHGISYLEDYTVEKIFLND